MTLKSNQHNSKNIKSGVVPDKRLVDLTAKPQNFWTDIRNDGGGFKYNQEQFLEISGLLGVEGFWASETEAFSYTLVKAQ